VVSVKPWRIIVLGLGLAALVLVAFGAGWFRPSQAHWVPLPDVTRQQVSAAQSTLEALGLSTRVTLRDQPSAHLPPGSVLGQRPAAGQTVERGTVVALVVQSG